MLLQELIRIKLMSQAAPNRAGPVVLTATGFVCGKGNFRPPTIVTLNRSPKNLSLVIMSVTPTAVPN